MRYAHFDNAPELVDACKKHGVLFQVSAPYLIESINRIETEHKRTVDEVQDRINASALPVVFDAGDRRGPAAG